jgi:polyisoprenoid-binding protein YceI
MKRLFITAVVLSSALLYSFKTVAPVIWTLDKNHAKIAFSISHNMTSDVEGSFKSFDATITTTGADFADAVFDFSADAASINTDNERRDINIRNMEFLDADKFQKVIFKSTSVTKKSTFTYQIKGNLTLHGVTKLIVLDAMVRFPPAALGLTKTMAGFKVIGTIKRSDFNIGAGFADMMLGDEIVLNVNGEFAKN